MSEDQVEEISLFKRREEVPKIMINSIPIETTVIPSVSPQSGDVNLPYLDFVGKFEMYLMTHKPDPNAL